MKTYIVKTKTAILEVFVYNERETETIILVNGGPGIYYYLNNLADFLKNDMKVIAFNQRGVGNSKALNKSYSVEEYLSDINNITLKFKLNKYHLFGHAWGGLLSQLYATRYSAHLKSLFLCNSFTGTGELWKNMECEIFDYYSTILFSKTRVYFEFLQYFLEVKGFSEMALRKMVSIMKNYYFRNTGYDYSRQKPPTFKVNPKVLFKTRQKIIQYPVKPSEKVPDIPVSILTGSKDIITESNWWVKERWPFAQTINLKESGHFPWLETTQDFYNIICQYYDLKGESF